MKTVWLKVVSLVMGFVAVLTFMHFVQEGRLQRPLQEIGLGDSASPSRAGHDYLVNLCPTRIKTVLYADGVRLLQEGREWIKQSAVETRKLDTVAVEKWLAQNCRIAAKPFVAQASGTFAPLVILEYVDQAKRTIQKSGDIYEMQGQRFLSDELESAFDRLREVPER